MGRPIPELPPLTTTTLPAGRPVINTRTLPARRGTRGARFPLWHGPTAPECRESACPARGGVLIEAALRALVPAHRLERAVAAVPARPPDLDALQRPVGGPHRVPVLHRGREPAPGHAGPAR